MRRKLKKTSDLSKKNIEDFVNGADNEGVPYGIHILLAARTMWAFTDDIKMSEFLPEAEEYFIPHLIKIVKNQLVN